MESGEFDLLKDYVSYACPSNNEEYLTGYINALIDYRILSLEQHNKLEGLIKKRVGD